ncbi:MAG: hypothetical protein JWQ74_1465 [Marmoricola sp.]|nr:hypothetical protein [Marmoricola sp.]
MLDTFQGLPVHALVVHATVVVVPVAALMVGLAAVYPRFRLWIGPGAMIAALISVVLVQLSTMSGDKLYDRLKQFGGDQPLIEDHERLAGLLIFLVIPLALIAIAAFVLPRKGATHGVLVAVSVLSVVAAGAVVVDVALIGHAGAKATWSDTIKNTKG